MEKGEDGGNLHCLLLSFPLQGHVNPMLQFSKRLKHKGIARITLAVTKFFLKSVKNFPTASLPVEAISDGFDDGGAEKLKPAEAYDICWKTGSETLTQLIGRLRSSGSGVDCLIYDPFYPWALDVAKKLGVKAAMFFTQSNSVNSIYFHAYKRELELPVTAAEIRIRGGLPVLRRDDLPSFVREYESDPGLCEFMVGQFRNVEMVDWIFVNTFYELEKEVCDSMAKMFPLKTIGPTIPSLYLDKRLPNDNEYGLSIFTPATDPCTNWLDKHRTKSVIYVSFGSFAEPGAEQIEELAVALKLTGMPFLWVVRASEESKLPRNYRDEVFEKGLIVSWCRQLDVLAHDAVSCFVTHCGWNSTLEAISSGVPMVAMPQWSDQSTNAKLVADIWKIGLRVRADEKQVVRREEIVRCIKCVVDSEMGQEIARSAENWKRLSREAADEGGSSDRNIEEFICALTSI